MNDNIPAAISEEFEGGFIKDETELLFLTLETAGGGAVLSDNVISPSIEFLASVDLSTGKFSKEIGRLEWLVSKNTEGFKWGFEFKQYNIYHIRCRKHFPVTLTPNMRKSMNNCYMVTELIDDGKSDPRLEKLKAKYLKPVHINHPKAGTFTLNNQFSCFAGEIDWLGNKCTVYLETDTDAGRTAKKAFNFFKKLYSDRESKDQKFRSYAAQYLTDTANDWLYESDDENEDDEKEITEEEFRDMLRISELAIDPKGDITLYYVEDNDIFGGHSIEITANISGEITGANLVG